MLCIIALGGLETCGSHFISVVLFGFSVLLCLCNLHNFVLFFSDCVEDGHGP